MRYRLNDLQLFLTPKAEKMLTFEGLPDVTFEFPGIVQTALAISCGLVRASLHGGEDHHEVVIRLYASTNPQETGENHVGKLYVRVFGEYRSCRFQTYLERLAWYADGSFDIISPEGERVRINPPRD